MSDKYELGRYVGQQLRRAREQRGHTQESLASAAGLSLSVVKKLESGRATRLDLGTYAAMVNALDVDPNDVNWFPMFSSDVSNQDWQSCGAALVDADMDSILSRRELIRAGVTAVLPLSAGSSIGRREIEQVRLAALQLAQLDHRVGSGGLVRHTAVVQWRWATKLLEFCPSHHRVELLQSIGRLSIVVGAIFFDSLDQRRARFAFEFARDCAEEANDWHLRAKSYSYLARLSTWFGDADQGVTFAECGLVRSDRLIPVERAMLLVARARALAKLGRVQDTLKGIGAADEAFVQSADVDHQVPWMQYYDDAQHGGETGHALVSLAWITKEYVQKGKERFASSLVGHGSNYARSRVFSRAKLATLCLLAGEVDEATNLGLMALTEIDSVSSGRARDYFAELNSLAKKHTDIPDTAELCTRLGGIGIT